MEKGQLSEEFFKTLTDALTGPGYFVFPDFLSSGLVAEVQSEIATLRERGLFQRAAVGRGSETRIEESTRGDGTFWFSLESLSPTQAEIAALLSSIKDRLNSELFLGLWDWEGHYAVYPPGAYYTQHLDRFSSDSRRTVSIVFFFNSDWKREDGGALRLVDRDQQVEVLPEAGTAVLFMSDRIPHEVLRTSRDRLSFAGWFRTRVPYKI